MLKKVIADNPQAVADYQGGKKKALGALVGQTMKTMKGKADPVAINCRKCYRQNLYSIFPFVLKLYDNGVIRGKKTKN